jgi:hypothetical protein
VPGVESHRDDDEAVTLQLSPNQTRATRLGVRAEVWLKGQKAKGQQAKNDSTRSAILLQEQQQQ